MKLLLLFLFVSFASAFLPQQQKHAGVSVLKMGYVPDGMSPEQYRKLKEKERETNAKKKFGAFGPQSFKSRSLQSFQKDLEQGKADHLMPVMFAKDRVKKGELKEDDIPYMQRLGSWDNSDLGSAKKKKWNEEDKKYNANAPRGGFDWTGGSKRRGGPATAKQQQQQEPKKKGGFFGLF